MSADDEGHLESKRQTRREQPRVIEHFVRTHDPLIAAADDKPQAAIELEPADDDCGGEGGLRVPIAGAILVVGVVDFELRPELAYMCLEGGVPANGPAEFVCVTGRNGDPECRLDVETGLASPPT